MEDRYILDGYLLPDHIEEKWSVDQICLNVASSQLDQSSQKGSQPPIPRTTRSMIPTTYTSPVTSMSATTVSVNRSPVAEGGALNLSISNRSSPSTSSILDSLAVQQHSNLQHLQSHHPSTSLQPAAVASSSHVNQRDSWPPDTYRGAYRDPQELKARRDSVDSDLATSSASSKTDDAASDEAGRERRRRQKLANKDNLFCQVCGDKANGYNFGAITCESCKAFFRRNAQKNKDLKCNFENACKIDHFTRKFCTACRLNKCFSVNMKKEWILDEDQLKKRKKLTRRTMREESSSSDYDSIHPYPLATSQMYGASNIPTMAHGAGMFMYVDPVLATAGALDQSTSEDKDYPPVELSAEDRAEIDRIMASHAMIDSGSNPSSVATTPSTPVNPPGDLPLDPLLPIKTEPAAEPVVVVEPEDPDDSGKEGQSDEPHSQPEQILNVAGGFITRLIKFVRLLPEFGELSQHDQVALLKGGIMETLVIRSAIVREERDDKPPDPSVDEDSSTSIPDRKSSSSSRDPTPPSASNTTQEMVTEHMKFVKSFNAAAKWDKPTMVLAMIVNLFSPDRVDLITRDVVARAAERYARLLQTYLNSIYSFKEAKALYPQLLQTLSQVRSYGEISSQHMVRVTLSDLEPLMREMFSIK